MITPFFFDFLGKTFNVIWQAVTSQVLLLDDHEIDAIPFGLLADISGFSHVCRIDGTVHAKTIENLFGLVDKILGSVLRHELGQVGLSQFVDIVQFAV